VEIALTFQEKRRVTLLGQAQAWLRLAHLTQANRHIAELAVQIAAQRAIVKHALDTGQGSEMAKSLLDALEGSLRIFERHRIFLLGCSGSSSALPPGDAATGRACHDATGVERHEESGGTSGQARGGGELGERAVAMKKYRINAHRSAFTEKLRELSRG
jgi:hypothetical protein